MRSLILLPVLATVATAQQVPTRTLATPDAKYAEPFSNLMAMREMRDGRVIAADPTDKTLQAIDLRAGRATPIGREGAGPTEWGMPIRVFPYPGDSTIVHDLMNARYLIVGPDGRAVRTFSPVADAALAGRGDVVARGGAAGGDARGDARGGAGGAAGRGGPGFAIGGAGISMPARASDGRGGLYSTAPAFVAGPGGMVSADSAPVTRLDVRTGKQDTLAYVNLAKNSASMTQRGSGDNQNVTVRMGSQAPFPAADDWVVLSDGSIAIVRTANYRVEIVQPNGRRVTGPAVPYTPVRVTEAEKEAWREARRSQRPIVATVDAGRGGGGANRQVSVGAPAQVQEPSEWPETLPPFVGNATWAAPNGEIWVVRTAPARDRNPSADVFNAQGQRIARVVMPPRTRIAGFGARHVYLVRMDEDDLQHLERYPLN